MCLSELCGPVVAWYCHDGSFLSLIFLIDRPQWWTIDKLGLIDSPPTIDNWVAFLNFTDVAFVAEERSPESGQEPKYFVSRQTTWNHAAFHKAQNVHDLWYNMTVKRSHLELYTTEMGRVSRAYWSMMDIRFKHTKWVTECRYGCRFHGMQLLRNILFLTTRCWNEQ